VILRRIKKRASVGNLDLVIEEESVRSLCRGLRCSVDEVHWDRGLLWLWDTAGCARVCRGEWETLFAPSEAGSLAW
jgi:hypothetical protein